MTIPNPLPHKDVMLRYIPSDGVIGAEWTTTTGEPVFTPGDEPTYAEHQDMRIREWRKLVENYEANPLHFYTAYHWLNEHPLFWRFLNHEDYPQCVHESNLRDDEGMRHGVHTSVHLVNPATGETDDEHEELNTKTEVWVEFALWPWPQRIDPKDPETYMVPTHAYQLDTGGDTYEEAIVNAAYNLWDAYGNDRRVFENDPDGLTALIPSRWILPPEQFDALAAQLDEGPIRNVLLVETSAASSPDLSICPGCNKLSTARNALDHAHPCGCGGDHRVCQHNG